MAVTMADITKLRNLTSAGLMDCKKALAETDGDWYLCLLYITLY